MGNALRLSVLAVAAVLFTVLAVALLWFPG